MRKQKCVNCGEPMLETYTRQGLLIYICVHSKMKKLDITHGAIYCNSIASQAEANKISYEYAKARYPKAVEDGAAVEALLSAFRQLTSDTGLTLDSLKRSVHDTASARALLESANLAITLGLPIEQLPALFNAAMRLGYALGITTEHAIRSLAIGIGRQSYMVLDNIGVVFRAPQAYEWFKAKHKLEKLEVTQKRQAWIAYAIEQVRAKAELLTISKDTKKIRTEQLEARIKDGHARLGEKMLTDQKKEEINSAF